MHVLRGHVLQEEEGSMRVIFSLVVMLSLVVSVCAEDPVDFPDPILRGLVESELCISDPTPSDMLSLTELTCCQCDIADLAGLEYAVNMQKLWLRMNAFSDLSPLSGLTNLRTLHLTLNEIYDVSPLSGLIHLEYLDLHGNNIEDVSPLAELVHLRTLILHQNQIEDISALSELTGLEWLDLVHNPLNEDAFDIYIPQIHANNPDIVLAHDGSYLRFLSISSGVGGSVVRPGEGQFTYEYGESVYMQAVADPGFVFVGFRGDYSTPQNPTILYMEQSFSIEAGFLCLLPVVYVDDNASGDPAPGDFAAGDPLENGTAEHPFDSIQEAVEVAADGASILVRPGTYHENIDFLGKRIQLLGIDPNDPNGTSYPVIDGGGAGPVVTFAGGEDPNCVLMGFVITGGRGGPAGAISCAGSSPTIMNCLIVGNRASDSNGAAVYCADSNAVFVNCTIADNAGGEDGAGLLVENGNVMVINSILRGNTPREILVAGADELSIAYSDVAGGWPGQGNIDVDPLFVRPDAWDDNGTPLNPADDVWIGGDYHLQSQAGRWDGQTQAWAHDEVTSPCIDAGDPASPLGAEPVPNGGIINLGAYGGTRETAKSVDSYL